VDREATLRTLTAILQGGRESIVGIADMLTEAGKGDDSKARYALHALAVHVGGLHAGRNDRAVFAQGVVAAIEARPPEVSRFLIRQLQVVGGREVVESLGVLLQDKELCDEAAQALLAIKAGAAEQFRKVFLPELKGKARLTIIHGLGTLRDREAVKGLKELAGDSDREVRLVALWALANIGDPGSVEMLIKASGGEGYERTKAAGSCLLLADRLLAAGNKAEAVRIYTHLRDSRTGESEKYFREAAIRGLSAAK
jgi:HEAT repeat protein